jgi:hypothetical protein
MTITLDLPEDIVRHLASHGEDPARSALEALALEGYRTRSLSEEQVRRMLGYETRVEVHGFLKQHGVYLNYSAGDFQTDLNKPIANR